jgi:hypothetical protein
MVSLYKGSCHCGAVQFEVRGEPTEFNVCDCSLCSRKNALMWAVPEQALRILSGKDKLTLYRWNTTIAEHYFCSICGIYTFHRKRMAPDQFGINVNCLSNIDSDGVPVRRLTGSGLSVETEPLDP